LAFGSNTGRDDANMWSVHKILISEQSGI